MEINVMDVMEQEKLTEAMEYIREYAKASVAYLYNKADADDAFYPAYADMVKALEEFDRSDMRAVCENPMEWLEA